MATEMIPRRRMRSLEVGAMGLGCMGMSTAYGHADESEAVATIHRALDLGANLLDTSDLYGAGANERLIGKALRERRDDAVIATKFGIVGVPGIGFPVAVKADPARARRCLDASLRRLGVDVIDLYFLHRTDPRVPIEEVVGAMAEMVAAGKVRELGLSEASPDTLRRAHAVHPIATLQSEWSIFSRDIEAAPLAVARELGVTVMPFSPLGRGMLTGSSAATTNLSRLDYRRLLPRWRKGNLEHNLALVEQVRRIADAHGVTAGQVALAWLFAKGDDVVPIPGTKRRKWLEQNVAALDVRLTPDDVAVLDGLRARGTRYSERSVFEQSATTPRPEEIAARERERNRRMWVGVDRVIEPVLTNRRVEKLIGHRTCSLHYVGRSSGKPVELTVWYELTQEGCRVEVGAAAKKSWWRNFRGAGHPCEVIVDGVRRSGHGTAHGTPPGKVYVDIRWV